VGYVVDKEFWLGFSEYVGFPQLVSFQKCYMFMCKSSTIGAMQL